MLARKEVLGIAALFLSQDGEDIIRAAKETMRKIQQGIIKASLLAGLSFI